MRRLLPEGLADGDYDMEVCGLDTELARDLRERPSEPPVERLTEDELLVEVLLGHASARFRYLDVRSRDSAYRERLRWVASVNIPLERVADEAQKAFSKETALVVYGEDEASTNAAASELEQLGFKPPTTTPGGFERFKRQGWEIEAGPA